MDQFGPRVSCLIGATSLGLGFSLAGLAVASENLPLLYVGGAIWGIANGWAYVPPVATLVNWFPDRKGFASGITVLGYGGGAIIAAPLFSKLIEHFRVIPEYLGSASDLELMNKDGTLFVDTATGFQEVVVATATDLKTVGLAAICEPGAYLVGTGSTGVAEAFGLLGLGYGTIMAACAFAFRLPPKGYMPSGGHDSSVSTEEKVATKVPDTPINAATFSPQFWLLYAGFGLSITGTYGLLSSGTVILNEAFGQNLPLMVTAGFTSAFVAGMSAANLTGRIVIPSISDTVGKVIGGDPFYARKYTYTALWSTAPFLYGGIIWSIHECASNPSVVPLAVFTGSTLGILSIFGGSTANRPAMIADIFGLKNMGVITARQLSVVMPASFLGPQTVAYFRKADTEKAIIDLSSKVDDNVFEQAFGAGKESLSCLIDSNTVTISRLLELAPHLQDPTPYLFDTSMYLMAGCQLAALSTNLALRPVCPPNSKVPK